MSADVAAPPGLVGERLRKALRSSAARTWPFRHWLLDHALPGQTLADVCALPFAPPTGARFDGRRETNNSTRVYVTPDLQRRFTVCRDLAAGFGAPETVAALEGLTGADLSTGRLRIEYCQDVDGFWLEPHVDVSVKQITILIYLSDDPALADAGTDIYEGPPAHRAASRAPCAAGKGLIFVPGEDTWHGFTPRPIRAVRRSLIINFVGPDWRAVEELA
jgi:hypothetical protein